jgi:hypothetical protein
MIVRRDLIRNSTGRRDGQRSCRWNRKVASLTLSLLLVGVFSLGSTLAISSAPANAATCDNFAAAKANVDGLWGTDGIVQVSYNPCNHRAWAYLVTVGPPCQSDGEWCGEAILNQSNGNQVACVTPVGSNECNSAQVSDYNITSFADGYIWRDINQSPAFGATGSW